MKVSTRECLAVVCFNSCGLDNLLKSVAVRELLKLKVADKFRYEGFEVARYDEKDVLQDLAAASSERLIGLLEGLDAQRGLEDEGTGAVRLLSAPIR